MNTYKRSPLALAVLALLTEAPMHPYRMQQLIKSRGKDQVINVRQRGSLYQTIEQKLVNDIAWIPMFQRLGFYALKPYVYGIVDNPTGETPSNDWANVYIAVH